MSDDMEVQAEPKPRKVKEKATTTPIKLLYDTWFGEERKPAGIIVDAPFEDARRFIAAGKAERADPFPGE